jgi:hypothetical protein
MHPDQVKLQTMEKSLTYETLSRDLEKLDYENLLNISKCYIKLYLSQQETLLSLRPIDKPWQS